MDTEFELRLTSLYIDGHRLPLRAGELAVRGGDADSLRDIEDLTTRDWVGWASVHGTFPVVEYATVVAHASDGRRLAGPAHITITATPSGTYLELSAVPSGSSERLDD